MHQGLTLSRPWLALVLVAFCLPLFVGLRQADLETDEAIYSFAVDRILEVGDWLAPKSSPSETAAFLEKPPLKFWIVAAPIKAGLLPHNEFGLRFWDALFGGVAFLYVFATGSLLAGPVCGAVAVLLLFVNSPLLLEHGIRGNNMEAPLFLSYCGGLFHCLRWASGAPSSRRRHAVAAGLYFVLGFMTKFVAAIFLPAVAGVAVLLFHSTRQRLTQDRRTWLGVCALVLALVAPWFVYAHARFGSLLWHTMLAEHVYARFTVGLNPEHIEPWSYYYARIWDALQPSGLAWLVPIGLVTLFLQTMRRRWFEGAMVLVWAVLPLALISGGSSKLYHYAFPFLPPLTIAAGYVVALVAMLAPAQVRRLLGAVEDAAARVWPASVSWSRRGWLLAIGTALVWLGAIAIIAALCFGSLKLAIGRTVLLKSSGIIRPMVVVLLAAVAMRRSSRLAPLIVALVIAWWMPIPLYADMWTRMRAQAHPLRTLSDCIQRVEASGSSRPGLYVDTDSSMWHPIIYYFRRIKPWTRQEAPSAANLAHRLYDAGSITPSLVQERRYHDYISGPDASLIVRGVTPPQMSVLEYTVLLPGPYGACSPETTLRARP